MSEHARKLDAVLTFLLGSVGIVYGLGRVGLAIVGIILMLMVRPLRWWFTRSEGE